MDSWRHLKHLPVQRLERDGKAIFVSPAKLVQTSPITMRGAERMASGPGQFKAWLTSGRVLQRHGANDWRAA